MMENLCISWPPTFTHLYLKIYLKNLPGNFPNLFEEAQGISFLLGQIPKTLYYIFAMLCKYSRIPSIHLKHYSCLKSYYKKTFVHISYIKQGLWYSKWRSVEPLPLRDQLHDEGHGGGVRVGPLLPRQVPLRHAGHRLPDGKVQDVRREGS